MAAAGYERSIDQINNKLKKLKKDYRDQKRDIGRSGNGRPRKNPHFDMLDLVLSERPANNAIRTDVIAGFLYSVLILMFFLPVLDLIDHFNLTCHYAPLLIISLHLALGLFSFTLDTWSTSRGDTAQILGTGAGVALGSHVSHLLGMLPDPSSDQAPFSMPPLSIALVAVAMLRLCLGVLVLVATRALMKAVTIPLVCLLSGVPSGDVRKARQHMEVELPYRYIVYGTVGFNVAFLVPLLFSFLQLS